MLCTCACARLDFSTQPSSADSATHAEDVSNGDRSYPRKLPEAQQPSGLLDESAVQKTVAHHHSTLRLCYGLVGDAQPSAASMLHLEATVTPSGSVSLVGVVERGVAVPERVASCLVQAVGHWTFPKPTGGSARVLVELQP
jgi:hypothetical protein